MTAIPGKELGSLDQTASGLAHDQLRRDFAVRGVDFAFFEDGINTVDYDADGGGAHGFHRLADRGERGRIDGRGGDVVKTNDGALLGNPDARLAQGANRSEGAHVVKGQERGEGTLLADEVFGEFVSQFEAGKWITGLGH